MLFQVRFHAGIVSGAITLTFRYWDSARVKPGGRYRFGLRHQKADYLEVEAIDRVPLSSIRDVDARQAGYKNRAELKADLTRYASPDAKLYRIRFHYAADQADVRDVLRLDLDRAALDGVIAKLQAMDGRSSGGPWTRQIMELIRDQPFIAASKLAPQVGRELLPLKTDIRKLKALGLTISHEVGYELSPRGLALLQRWAKPG